MIKVVTIGLDGKVSFTKEELEKLLEEAYEEGKADGIESSHDKVTYVPYPVYYQYPVYPVTYSDYRITCGDSSGITSNTTGTVTSTDSTTATIKVDPSNFCLCNNEKELNEYLKQCTCNN